MQIEFIDMRLHNLVLSPHGLVVGPHGLMMSPHGLVTIIFTIALKTYGLE